MIKRFRRAGSTFLAVVLLAGILTGCGADKSAAAAYKRGNDIVTFTIPQEGKEIVRVAFAMNMDWKPLIEALDRKFPEKQFIYDFYATAGDNPSMDTVRRLVRKNDYDFVVANYWYAPSLGADISSEAFLDNYLQTTLDSLAVDGRIYGIPLPMAAAGIYYNKDLFDANGWTIPASTDEFIALCSRIRAAGYSPYDACLKYESQTMRILEGMTYDEVFNSNDSMNWYSDLIAGKATFAEHAKPMFELAKKLLDGRVLSMDGFTASLTEMRENFFTGKTAMIDYSSDLLVLAETEGCKYDIEIAPYPSTTGKNTCVLYNPSTVLYIPADVKSNGERYAFDTSVMDYLSTSEGQDALLTGWSGVASLKNYAGQSRVYDQVADYVESGRYHMALSFSADPEMSKPLKKLMNNAVSEIGGGTDVDTAVRELDNAYSSAVSQGIPEEQYETIARASEDFTVLETSYYIADKIRESTGADVALVPNGGFYRSNLADIPKGDITNDMRLFYQKGIGDKDFITTYKMTGAQLKTLLEHPVINGMEQTQFIAAAGLNSEYAPWHPSGSRLVNVTLADGTAVDDAAEYTIAAYAGVIDESYITSTLQTFEALGNPEIFIENALRTDGTISPDLAGRLKLDWDILKGQ